MDPDSRPMHGRHTETAHLRALLDGLPGSGGALVLRGGPGAGKTRLLHWTVGQAAARGFRVVTVTAVEGDAYAGAGLLLDQLPPAVGERPRELIAAGLPLAKVAPALLTAVAAVAEEQPVLLAVDDAHWLDQPSWTALAFVARRLVDDPAVLVLALREGAAAAARLPGSGLAELPVGPLGAGPARELLERQAPGLRPDLAEQVLAQAAGNPLALVELGAAARAGPAVDRPLTPRLRRTFGHAAEHLPEPARTLVQVAALNDGPDGDEVVEAARLLDPAVSEDDLGPAVAAGVLEITADFQLGFRHPLVRSAVREGTGSDRRRHVHRALSTVLTGSPTRQTWHRANAAAVPDARLTADLADAAARAQQQGALVPAAQAYERAAELTGDPGVRADLLLSAAYSAHEAGDTATVRRLLGRLDEHVLPATARARHAQLTESIGQHVRTGPEPVRHFLGVVEALVRQGETDLALRSFEFQAHDLMHADPDRATRDRVVELVDRLPLAGDDPRRLGVLGLTAPLEQWAAVLPAVRRYATTLVADPAELHLLARAAYGIGALPAGLRLAGAAVTGLRAQGRRGLLVQALNLQAGMATQLGNLALAGTGVDAARQAAAGAAQPRWAITTDLVAARAAALRGDTGTARAVADTAERALRLAGSYPMLAFGQLVRGQAAAAEGRFDAAFDDLRVLFDSSARTYHPHLRFWALPFLAEAALLGNRERHLAEVVAELAPLRPAGLPLLQVGLSYADAVLADSAEQYSLALARTDLPEWPFELARLHHAYGTWLRRQRRSAEARPFLRSAAKTFSGLGAVPWAARADADLRDSGERTQRGPGDRQTLTPQELQIAGLAAEGLTNREIAHRLVLSPQAVGSHLYRVFRKLGITSRTQLTKVLRP